MGNSGKIRILAIGDTHGDRGLIRKIAEIAEKEKIDIIILAGDITLAEYTLDYVVGPLKNKVEHVLLLPGNHESIATVDFLAEKYNMHNLHGKSFKKGHVGIFGAGTALMGPHAIPEIEILRTLEKSHNEIQDSAVKIMATHIHPFGSKSEFSGFEGSKAVRDAIEKFQPDIAVNAHIEEAAGVEELIGKTKVINISRKERIFEF
jgi:hypothetical protein